MCDAAAVRGGGGKSHKTIYYQQSLACHKYSDFNAVLTLGIYVRYITRQSKGQMIPALIISNLLDAIFHVTVDEYLSSCGVMAALL